MESIKIERGIPIPPHRAESRTAILRDALGRLDIGDSFTLFELNDTTITSGLKKEIKRDNPNFNITIRRISSNQWRVWRIS